jgi:hypothetical protein
MDFHHLSISSPIEENNCILNKQKSLGMGLVIQLKLSNHNNSVEIGARYSQGRKT